MSQRAFHIQRPLVCLALSFALGIFAGGYAGGFSFILPVAGLISSVLLVALLVYSRKPLLLGLCFLLFFSGMVRAQVAVNPFLPPEGKYHITAAVAGVAERREDDGRVKAVLRDLEMEDEQANRYRIRSAYWTYYPSADSLLPLDGQHINITASVYHPLGRQNPQGFNFRLYLLQRGITLGVSGAMDLMLTPLDQKSPSDPWLRARIWLSNLYDEAIGEGSELIRALLWGDRGGLGDEVEGSFRDTGITHVLSVSGLHVSILAGALLFMLSALGMPPRWRFVVVVIALALYCRLLNFEAPVLRSAVMSAVLLGARLYDERSDPLTSLSVAMMVILAFRPLDLFHVGFQLSFLAVLGMFTLGDRLNDLYGKAMRHRKRNRHVDKGVAALQVTVSATAFTAPVMINTFHGFSLIGVLISPIACLIVGFLMLYGAVIMPIAILWMPLAQLLAVPLSWGSRSFIGLTEAIASLPFPDVRSASLGGAGLALCYTALLLCTRYVRIRKPLFRLAAAALAASLMIGLSYYSRQMDRRDVRYTLFSSGSADAAVIEDGRMTYVIDTAEHGGDLSSYLKSKGRDIDILFISHLHNDHIGGLKELMEQRVTIRQIVLPAHAEETKRSDDSHDILRLAKEAGISVRYAAKGDRFEGERVKLDVLWPIYGKMYPSMDANHNSLALLVDLNGLSLLTAGDLTQEYEMYSAVPAQVLKIAHHGAKGSTSPGYLQTVSPQLALLTANSARMQYAASALKKLDAMDVPVWGTQEGRAVIMTISKPGSVSIQHYKDRGI